MNKYQNGKIYKIINDVDDMVYIGSTILELYERWGRHLSNINKTRKIGNHILKIGFEHFKIVLVCAFPCNTLRELLWKEMEEINKIEKDKLLITIRPLVFQSNTTGKERKREYESIYHDKEKKKLADKKWYEKNYEQKCKTSKEYYERTKFLRKYLPYYNVTQKETHLYF